MKRQSLALVLFSAAVLCSGFFAQAQHRLSKKEKADGWQLLFDGNTTVGWRDAFKDNPPKRSWKVDDGTLQVLPKREGDTTSRGDIVTQKMYNDFELVVDFKLTEGANSGIKYFVDGRALGLEYQLIDDIRHPDAKMGKNGNHTLASLYDLIPATDKKPSRVIGEWNTAKIVSKGRHVEHWLNGVKVLEYERGSEAFKKLVADSKYKDLSGFGLGPEGRILLQDHGNEVHFKNIKIRVLKAEE